MPLEISQRELLLVDGSPQFMMRAWDSVEEEWINEPIAFAEADQFHIPAQRLTWKLCVRNFKKHLSKHAPLIDFKEGLQHVTVAAAPDDSRWLEEFRDDRGWINPFAVRVVSDESTQTIKVFHLDLKSGHVVMSCFEPDQEDEMAAYTKSIQEILVKSQEASADNILERYKQHIVEKGVIPASKEEIKTDNGAFKICCDPEKNTLWVYLWNPLTSDVETLSLAQFGILSLASLDLLLRRLAVLNSIAENRSSWFSDWYGGVDREYDMEIGVRIQGRPTDPARMPPAIEIRYFDPRVEEIKTDILEGESQEEFSAKLNTVKSKLESELKPIFFLHKKYQFGKRAIEAVGSAGLQEVPEKPEGIDPQIVRTWWEGLNFSKEEIEGKIKIDPGMLRDQGVRRLSVEEAAESIERFIRFAGDSEARPFGADLTWKGKFVPIALNLIAKLKEMEPRDRTGNLLSLAGECLHCHSAIMDEATLQYSALVGASGRDPHDPIAYIDSAIGREKNRIIEEMVQEGTDAGRSDHKHAFLTYRTTIHRDGGINIPDAAVQAERDVFENYNLFLRRYRTTAAILDGFKKKFQPYLILFRLVPSLQSMLRQDPEMLRRVGDLMQHEMILDEAVLKELDVDRNVIENIRKARERSSKIAKVVSSGTVLDAVVDQINEDPEFLEVVKKAFGEYVNSSAAITNGERLGNRVAIGKGRPVYDKSTAVVPGLLQALEEASVETLPGTLQGFFTRLMEWKEKEMESVLTEALVQYGGRQQGQAQSGLIPFMRSFFRYPESGAASSSSSADEEVPMGLMERGMEYFLAITQVLERSGKSPL